MDQTKGYLTVTGIVKFLGAKSLRDSSRALNLRFAVETRPENIINVEGFGWKKEDTDNIYVNTKEKIQKSIPYADRLWIDIEGGETLVGTAVKKAGDDKAVSMVDVDAVQYISDNFKNGDSVFVKLKSDVDGYRNNLKWIITAIYAQSNDIDFKSDEFEEKNHGMQWIIYDGIKGNVVTGTLAGSGKNNKTIKMDFVLSKDIAPEAFQQFKKGQLVQLDFELTRTPVYKDVEVKNDKKSDFQPIGKYANSGNPNGTIKHIDHVVEAYTCVGIRDAKADVVVVEEENTDVPF